MKRFREWRQMRAVKKIRKTFQRFDLSLGTFTDEEIIGHSDNIAELSIKLMDSTTSLNPVDWFHRNVRAMMACYGALRTLEKLSRVA